ADLTVDFFVETHNKPDHFPGTKQEHCAKFSYFTQTKLLSSLCSIVAGDILASHLGPTSQKVKVVSCLVVSTKLWRGFYDAEIFLLIYGEIDGMMYMWFDGLSGWTHIFLEFFLLYIGQRTINVGVLYPLGHFKIHIGRAHATCLIIYDQLPSNDGTTPWLNSSIINIKLLRLNRADDLGFRV
ncbi:hypothetical protein ACJX0J_025996, partial [Zea mays]